jgi:hypothetical protein
MTVEFLLFLILVVLVVAVLPKLVGFVFKALIVFCALIGALLVIESILS